jgi:hypothetical protein
MQRGTHSTLVLHCRDSRTLLHERAAHRGPTFNPTGWPWDERCRLCDEQFINHAWFTETSESGEGVPQGVLLDFYGNL